MNILLDIVVTVTIILGALFTLVGSYGLVKLDVPMSRLHAPTKAGTLGVGSILVASMIHNFATGEGFVHEILITAFLFVTAPVSAYFIAKVTIHRDRNTQDLPDAGGDAVWATRSKDTPVRQS